MRRHEVCVAIAGAWLALLGGCALVPDENRVEQVQSLDDRSSWLTRHVHKIPRGKLNEDTVAVIVRAIGNSRVVMLGELTHGDGAAFEFKAELVQRLHRDHGFDVLIWESGLFDCAVMDQELQKQKPIVQVARTGVFGHWSLSAETLPLFEYARATKATSRPLVMAGFDLQESGTASWHRWPTYLEWIDDAAGLDEGVHSRARRAVADAANIAQAPDPAAEQQRIVGELRASAQPIADWYAAQDPGALGVANREYRFRAQCLKSEAQLTKMMEMFVQGSSQRDDAKMIEAYNLREQVNAENLLWLVNEHFAGKKVMVWAHNVHISVCSPSGTEVAGSRVSMGTQIKRELADQVYAIGMVGFQGTWSWLDNPPIEYAPPAAGSLEEACGTMGIERGFLDLTPCRSAGHWLMVPRPGYMDQQAATLVELKWPMAYDGVVFFREMSPRRGVPTGAGTGPGTTR